MSPTKSLANISRENRRISADALIFIKSALEHARKKFPDRHDDIVHAVAVIAEEAGEALRAALTLVHEPEKGSIGDVLTEVAQTAATCIRFLDEREGA